MFFPRREVNHEQSQSAEPGRLSPAPRPGDRSGNQGLTVRRPSPRLRDLVNAIVDKDIPVPGVDGLSVRVKPRGAGATYRNIGGSGVTFSSSVQVGGAASPNVEVMLTFDLTKYLR